MGLTHLRLEDYSDRELLMLVRDLAEASPNGCVSSSDVAKAVGVTGDRASASAGSRMSYLARIGAVEKRPKERGKAMWSITDDGAALITGKMTTAQAAAIMDAKPGALLLMTRALATRTVHTRLNGAIDTLAWREYRRSTGRR